MVRCEICGEKITAKQVQAAGPARDGTCYLPRIHYACRDSEGAPRLHDCGHLVGNPDDTCKVCVKAHKTGSALQVVDPIQRMFSVGKGKDGDLLTKARDERVWNGPLEVET